jgi:hypothetical protein
LRPFCASEERCDEEGFGIEWGITTCFGKVIDCRDVPSGRRDCVVSKSGIQEGGCEPVVDRKGGDLMVPAKMKEGVLP